MPDGTDPQWLILTYRVPSEPTRLRASVWRRLKTLGAIYLVNATAALPASVSNERALRRLRSEIIDEMHGTATLFLANALANGADVVTMFNLARNDEYEEIIDRCQDFLAQVEKEIVAEHYTYAELEENEEDFAKLQRWFDKVKARDLLGAHGMSDAEMAIARCAQVLEGYADAVYEREGGSAIGG
ncbi:MAG: Chromate resistance protein ChrB [Acidimicrobiales bacterium]